MVPVCCRALTEWNMSARCHRQQASCLVISLPWGTGRAFCVYRGYLPPTFAPKTRLDASIMCLDLSQSGTEISSDLLTCISKKLTLISLLTYTEKKHFCMITNTEISGCLDGFTCDIMHYLLVVEYMLRSFNKSCYKQIVRLSLLLCRQHFNALASQAHLIYCWVV